MPFQKLEQQPGRGVDAAQSLRVGGAPADVEVDRAVQRGVDQSRQVDGVDGRQDPRPLASRDDVAERPAVRAVRDGRSAPVS